MIKIDIIYGRLKQFWTETGDLSINNNLRNLNRNREELLLVPSRLIIVISNSDRSTYMSAVIRDDKNFIYFVDMLGVFQVVSKRKSDIENNNRFEYYSARSADIKVYTNNVNMRNINELLIP